MKKLKTVSLILLITAVILMLYTGWRQWSVNQSDIYVIQKDIVMSFAFVMLILSYITHLVANELKRLEEKLKKEIDKLGYKINSHD